MSEVLRQIEWVRWGYLVHVGIFYTNCQAESLYISNKAQGTLPALFHSLTHVNMGFLERLIGLRQIQTEDYYPLG